MKEERQLKRYYVGVDWADKDHRVYVGDENATKIVKMKVKRRSKGWQSLAAGSMREELRGLSFGRPSRSLMGGS